jgi:hypothetical protein
MNNFKQLVRKSAGGELDLNAFFTIAAMLTQASVGQSGKGFQRTQQEFDDHLDHLYELTLTAMKTIEEM